MTRYLSALAFLLASMLDTHSVIASTQIYDFTADCSDCSGVIGHLTLTDYTPGTPLTRDNFVSFVYSSSVFSPSIAFTADSLQGTLPVNGLADFNAQLFNDTFDPSKVGYFFVTDLTGVWQLAQGGSVLDRGTGYNFALEAAVPEPSTWAMMILGFAGIGFRYIPSAKRFARSLISRVKCFAVYRCQ
jgi:hypothetical protein